MVKKGGKSSYKYYAVFSLLIIILILTSIFSLNNSSSNQAEFSSLTGAAVAEKVAPQGFFSTLFNTIISFFTGAPKEEIKNNEQGLLQVQQKETTEATSISTKSSGDGNLGILAAPSVDSLLLNTTNPATNNTAEDLTAYVTTSDTDGDSVKVIYNWLVNGTVVNIVNMPFENNTADISATTKDYSGYGNNGSVSGATWNSTGGYDGKGAYQFDGNNDYITVVDNPSLKGMNELTISVWVNKGSKDIKPISYWIPNHYILRETSGVMQFYTYTSSQVGGSFSFGGLPGWHHYVAVYNGSTMMLYRDGVKDSTTYAQTGAIGSGSGSNLIIGAEYDLSTPQDGAIDEVRIYNRSLSQQQILNLYNNYTNRFADEETKVGDILSVQAIPNDGTSDGNMVTSNNVTITDNVIPTVDSLILNTTNPLTNSSVENLTAYPTISDSTGESVKSIYNWILNGNSILLAYFPFERIGGTSTNNARDYISGNNLSEAGGVYWKKAGGYDGKGAYEFDGTNDYLISSGSGLFPNVINSFTMELWVNPTATRANSSESISGTAGISGQRYAIFPANGKNQYTDFHAGAGISVGTNGISVFELSQDYMPSPLVYDATITGWNHVVVVYTNRQPKLYLNGVLVRTGQTSSYTIHPSIDLGEVGAGYGYFKGILDEVRLWNRSLSAEQVLALYNNRTDLIVSNETSVYDNWTAQVTPNDGFVDGATSTSNSIIISSFVVPTQNENDVFGQDEGIGTSLSSVNPASIQTVSNYVWHSLNKGKVQWKVALNLSNANIGNDDDLDNDIEFGDGFVSVNSTSAPAFASKSANITFENMDCNLCNNDGIIYTSGAYTTLADIRTNGQSCSISGRCSAFTCDNPGGIGNCTFDVSSFSGYAYGGNANLTINDSAEGSSVNIDTSINFFAYYVNSTDGAAIPSASCNISFDDAPSIWNQMTWNGTGDNGYNYTKSSGFSSAATHVWNVTCAKSGYTSLTANDTILVTSLYIPPAVPEFENYAILFILVTVIGGFFIMKNKF